MDKHIFTSTQKSTNSQPEASYALQGDEFPIGTEVIYGIHGKCQVLTIESREVSGQVSRFYKLEVQKSALSRSAKREPAIWLPVASARAQGLRPPMSLADAEAAMSILMSREFFFNPAEPWSQVYPKLEATLRNEGGPGLARVYSYLYVLKRRQVVPASDVVKLLDSVYKIMIRELAEAFSEAPRILEEKMAKGLRQKLLADQ